MQLLKNKWVAGAVLVVLLTAVIAGSIRSTRSTNAVMVYYQAAAARDLIAAVTASGEIRPEREVKVSSKIMGEIRRIHVREGQSVRRGDILLEIDTRKLEQDLKRLRASLDAASAQMRSDEAVLKNAEDTLRRNQEMAERGFVSEGALDAVTMERDTAVARLQASQARFQEAQAAVARMDEELRDARIFATMDGVVTRVHSEEGENVIAGTLNIPGTVILELADMSSLLAKVEVDETDVVSVALGQKAEVLADAIPDHPYAGSVAKISAVAVPGTDKINIFPVEVKILDNDGRLMPGMSCDAKIETGRRESVLAVPIGAVITYEGRRVVFAVGEKDKAERRYVSLGISDDTHVEILEGVAAGDRVITGPYRTLRSLDGGDRVKPKVFTGKEEKKEK